MGIEAICLQHLAEFAELWQRREQLLADEEATSADLARTDRGLLAHADGLSAAGEAACHLLAQPFYEDDPDRIAAAVVALLDLDVAGADRVVVRHFLLAEGEQLQAIVRGLCVANVERILDVIVDMALYGEGSTCVAAAEVLARHRRLEPDMKAWRAGLTHDDPLVRRAVWRVVALADRDATG
ncbi:MAG: hypothetical protein AB7F89_22330 [Pirellulaceae bacterium]